jgi:hypothetical protein
MSSADGYIPPPTATTIQAAVAIPNLTLISAAGDWDIQITQKIP